MTLEGSCHCERVKFTVDSCSYADDDERSIQARLGLFRYTLSVHDLPLPCRYEDRRRIQL